MGFTMNQKSFQYMIDENIKWLNQYPNGLSKSHIIAIMNDYTEKFYSEKTLVEKLKLDEIIKEVN